MDCELRVFFHEKFGEVRGGLIDGEPWFVGADVARAMGYKNTKSALAYHVDPADKRRDLPLMGKRVVKRDPFRGQGSKNAASPEAQEKGSQIATLSGGRGSNPTFINESGLYSLILGSKLHSAKQFKRWVTAEVLPAIRQTGSYVLDAAASPARVAGPARAVSPVPVQTVSPVPAPVSTGSMRSAGGYDTTRDPFLEGWNS